MVLLVGLGAALKWNLWPPSHTWSKFATTVIKMVCVAPEDNIPLLVAFFGELVAEQSQGGPQIRNFISKKHSDRSEIVVHTCNPSCLEGVNRRIFIQAGLGKKLKSLSQK
jgi:hypothetical protein